MFEFTGCCVHLSWMEIVSGKIVEARSQRERSNAAMAQQMLMLAMEFERAAAGLRTGIRKGVAATWAPYRFTALHAIELYLSAYLRLYGIEDGVIRKTGHHFRQKAEMATMLGLKLRQKTLQHLDAIGENREYLVARYHLEELPMCSQVNRLEATLAELAGKINKDFQQKTPPNCSGGVKISQIRPATQPSSCLQPG